MIHNLVDREAIRKALESPTGWRGSDPERPTFFEKDLFDGDGYRVCLHRFVAADKPQCFHSHPATAVRMVLIGGYVEEFPDGGTAEILEGHIGVVFPEMAHRVHRVLNGEESVSLWVRGPKTHKTQLIGQGWL